MQQDAIIVGSAGKKAGFCRHGLSPLGVLEWVNRIMRANDHAPAQGPLAFLLLSFMVTWRYVDRCCGSPQFLRPAAWGCGPPIHWTRHSLAVGRYRWPARARHRLCDTLSRPLS